jgi:uncharacterized protein
VVFGWEVRGTPGHPSFTDGTGHVIGHWVTDLPVAGEAGVLPYVYVQRIDDTLAEICAQGGETVRAPYPEGDLWVATFRDPAGNVLGIWQRGPARARIRPTARDGRGKAAPARARRRQEHAASAGTARGRPG